MALSQQELQHFYTHGYVVKQAIADLALCHRARDHLWWAVPRSKLDTAPSLRHCLARAPSVLPRMRVHG